MFWLNLDSKATECYRIVADGEPLDYIMYTMAFMLCNLAVSTVALIYLLCYLREEYAEFNQFILFPITQIILEYYYVGIKTYVMLKP